MLGNLLGSECQKFYDRVMAGLHLAMPAESEPDVPGQCQRITSFHRRRCGLTAQHQKRCGFHLTNPPQ